MISLLLIDSDDDDSGYLAHLLFDVTKSDSQIPLPKVSSAIYDSLHWKLKKIFKESDDIVKILSMKRLAILMRIVFLMRKGFI